MSKSAGQESMSLRVARTDAGLHLHLQGRATQQVWQAVDRVISAYRRARPHEPLITIDCENCQWIDSTLAGWLLETAAAIRANSGGLRLANCSRSFRESLRRLHIEDRFDYCSAASPKPARSLAFRSSAEIRDELFLQMLRSHQSLMKIHRDNALLLAPVVASIHLELARRNVAVESEQRAERLSQESSQAEPSSVLPAKRGETAT